ncbi:methyltransferase regulatory domain-containing protein [Achromobacter insolitus]|uniref:methyltransferase regulatory domain-containing protein n=1 Tax=Achromobacter insolitus TaxID=217204 RepID=UPI00241D3A17|nr:class I SAM-dependent methyltransferase [Achromobacter insolitus]
MTEPALLNQSISDSYDETPYTSNAFMQTAPGHLRAVAQLYGLDTPPLGSARILELGCAAGGNLIPFAVAHPEARVVGIDLSPEQIAAGQAIARQLNVQNLQLKAMSITDIDANFGQFDYIICHGVFSWVPPFVREAILRVCRENLSPAGVAYVSYNTYPGWKTSDIVRDAFQLNSFGAQTAAEKLQQAKAMLDLLEHGLAPNNRMRQALQETARSLRQMPDHYLLHEFLEDVNSPCYFLEFVAMIQQAGLTYLSDTQPEGSFASNYGTATAAALEPLSMNTTREMREQYLDIAVGRQFRQSLLVHCERAGQILERPEANHFIDMTFAAQLAADAARDQSQPGTRHFRTPSGITVVSQDASMIALIELLQQKWPVPIDFNQARDAVASKSGLTGDELEHATLLQLVTLLNCGALLYRLEPVDYVCDPSKPRLISGARELLRAASHGSLQIGYYNLWHQLVNVSDAPAARYVANLLDGSLTQQEIRTRLRDALTSGTVEHPDGLVLKGARNADPIAQNLLVRILAALRTGGLLQ